MAIVDRMMRAAKGDVNLFEEVEHDPSATTEALIVVVIVALAGGIGGALATAGSRPGGLIGAVIGAVISALLGWAVFAGVTYFVGTRLFKGEATWEEVLRTLGYAYSPNVLQIVVFIPIVGWLVALIAGLWGLYLSFIGIRAALDISSGQTIGTILISIIPTIIIVAIVRAPFALMGM